MQPDADGLTALNPPPPAIVPPPMNGAGPTDSEELQELLHALQAVRVGDFSVRLPGHRVGLVGKIAGSRILDDAFLNSSTAVCVPKGKPAALSYVSKFIEDAKASGLVRKALDEMGLKCSQIAPAGMKP